MAKLTIDKENRGVRAVCFRSWDSILKAMVTAEELHPNKGECVVVGEADEGGVHFVYADAVKEDEGSTLAVSYDVYTHAGTIPNRRRRSMRSPGAAISHLAFAAGALTLLPCTIECSPRADRSAPPHLHPPPRGSG